MEPAARQSVAVITLGCARNEVDSEELAARLHQSGWAVVADPEAADVVMVNTCGFVEQAKQESIDVVLAAADTGRPVVAVGCLAQRYGSELAAELPEASVLGFDDYPDIADRLDDALAGVPHTAHAPGDRRRLLPISPVDRAGATAPGHGHGTELGSELLTGARLLHPGPSQPVKLASGCDRRCAFCAIPQFRGAFVSRPPEDVLAEIGALVRAGVSEVLLVSENSTSYGKDLGDLRALEGLLRQAAETPGLLWLRPCYLQPAELRPTLVEVLATTPGVAPYFDLSFQHASGAVLRRMRRFGSDETFLELLGRIRALRPDAGVRSNFIVGFPGETEEDVQILVDFLAAAELDAIGLFGYSDEDGTEAVALPGHLPESEVADRLAAVRDVADAVMSDRAEARVGEVTQVLVESVDEDGVQGRAGHQGPEDGGTIVSDAPAEVAVGDVLTVRIVESLGVDVVGTVVADGSS